MVINNFVAEKTVNSARVVLADENGAYRIIVEFLADPGQWHDAGNPGQTLFGAGTRLTALSDATPIERQYALTRFRDICATIC